MSDGIYLWATHAVNGADRRLITTWTRTPTKLDNLLSFINHLGFIKMVSNYVNHPALKPRIR